MIGRAKLLVTILCIGFSTSAGAHGDDRAAWLGANALPLSTLRVDDSEVVELQPLRRWLEDVDMVLLGEATRGDGSTFEAKTRLVRFLHEHLDFDILAFECGFFACHQAWQSIKNGQRARSALGQTLFPLYVDSREFQPLLDLLDQYAGSEQPLEVAGFDNQLSESNLDSLRASLAEAMAPCPRTGQGLEETWAVIEHVAAGTYASGQQDLPSMAVRRRVDTDLDRISDQLTCAAGSTPESHEPKDFAFWQQVVANLRSATELTWALGKWDPQTTMDPAIHNARDQQMADNLLWLRRRYPGRKIIVWSLTLHLARDLGGLETGESDIRKRFSRFELLGERLAAELEPDPYVVGFTAYQGQKGSIFQQPHSLLVPTRGSLEDLLGHTDLELAFLDLRHLSSLEGGAWLARPLIARPIAFKELRGVWPEHLDAFFYIRTLSAAHRESP